MKIIDIADKLPAKLKSNCANHIDHILLQLGSTQFVGIRVAEYEVDNHVPLTPILDMLSEIDGVSMSLHMCDDTLSNTYWKGLYGLAVDSDGDTYVISESHDVGLCYVAKHTVPEHAYYKEEWDIGTLSSEFNISAIIIFRKKQNQSSLGQPFVPPPSKDEDISGSAAKEHYWYFSSHCFVRGDYAFRVSNFYLIRPKARLW